MADEGFEPSKAMPADLQSAPFGRSGNLPQVALDEHLKRIQGPDPNLQLGRRRSQFGASTRLGGNSHARFHRAPPIADKGAFMASESSFDIVSKVDRQEADNALN